MKARGVFSRPASALAMVLLTVGLVALAMYNGLSVRTDGPLPPGHTTQVTFPIQPGATGTWGTVLPVNPSEFPLVLESVEPVNASDGIQVGAVLTSNPEDSGVAVGTLDVFPPPGITTAPVKGSTLPPAAQSPQHLQVLVSVSLTPGHDDGTIDALRVRYRAGGTLYEVILPDALRLVPAS